MKDELEWENYMDVFKENWERHVTTDGELDLDKVARELADCSFIIQQYKKVMENVTMGRVSKIFTYGEEINNVHRKIFIHKGTLADDIYEMQDELGQISYDDFKKYLNL